MYEILCLPGPATIIPPCCLWLISRQEVRQGNPINKEDIRITYFCISVNKKFWILCMQGNCFTEKMKSSHDTQKRFTLLYLKKESLFWVDKKLWQVRFPEVLVNYLVLIQIPVSYFQYMALVCWSLTRSITKHYPFSHRCSVYVGKLSTTLDISERISELVNMTARRGNWGNFCNYQKFQVKLSKQKQKPWDYLFNGQNYFITGVHGYIRNKLTYQPPLVLVSFSKESSQSCRYPSMYACIIFRPA